MWPGVHYLARADGSDPTLSNLLLILFGLLVVGIAAILAYIPVRVARGRYHRHAEVITTLMIFWSVTTAGIAIKTFLDQQKWSAERQSQILSGYFDPAGEAGRPPWPVKTAIALAASYLGVLGWAVKAKVP
jgi:hypothetical protein